MEIGYFGCKSYSNSAATGDCKRTFGLAAKVDICPYGSYWLNTDKNNASEYAATVPDQLIYEINSLLFQDPNPSIEHGDCSRSVAVGLYAARLSVPPGVCHHTQTYSAV